MKPKPVVGITLGDPSGIGPEVVIHALADERVRQLVRPVVFGDTAVIEQTLNLTGLELKFKKINAGSIRQYNGVEIAYIPTGIITEPAIPGIIDGDCGRAAFVALSTGIDAMQQKFLDAVVTSPVKKESLKIAGCFPIEQIEILAQKTACKDLETVVINGRLRIFFLTRHIPLRDVFKAITKEALLQSMSRCEKYLKQLGILKPALAVAAVNPRGSEAGLFGAEERDILRPAIELVQRELRDVRGPVPADTVFHQAMEGKFDAVLALYHDQGYIAAKTLDFHRTITLTMGLPFLLTSVGHGTAFDIAGKGIANPQSMIEAILYAADHWESLGKNKV